MLTSGGTPSWRALEVVARTGSTNADLAARAREDEAGGLVLIAELSHSAVDALARAIGDPEGPGLRAARDIAAAGVVVAVIASASISITVLSIRLGEFLGWWDRIAT